MITTSDKTMPLFNVKGLERDLPRECVASLVEIVREQMPLQLRDLIAAWQCHNWEGVRRAAHTMKGTAGSIGAECLRLKLAALEERAKSGQVEEIDNDIHDTQVCVIETEEALQSWMP